MNLQQQCVSHTEYSGPSLEEKFQYYEHQKGIAGKLNVRLVEAKQLNANTSWWTSKINPFVIFTIGNQNARSSTIHCNSNPTWRREKHDIQVQKLNLSTRKLGLNVRTSMKVEVLNEDSLANRVTESVGIRRGQLIGVGSIDFTDLVEGLLDVMDVWIPLKDELESEYDEDSNKSSNKMTLNKETCRGEIRLILEYEPHGMEPIVGDMVMLEGFGLYPTAILPPLESFVLTVQASNGKYLLGTYTTSSGFEASIRLHRSCVFVIHRTSFLECLVATTIMEPLTYISNTPVGKQIKEATLPYVNAISAFSAPVVMATKATVVASTRASVAAISAIFKA